MSRSGVGAVRQELPQGRVAAIYRRHVQRRPAVVVCGVHRDAAVGQEGAHGGGGVLLRRIEQGGAAHIVA